MTKIIVDKIKSLKYRLQMNIIKNPKTKCWEWTKFKNRKGYGVFCGKSAHRISYEIYVGEIHKDKIICHHCDNPSCVNPKHLWMGTIKENNEDRDKKGRLKPNIGEKHGMCKISQKIAMLIKKRIINGEPMAKIARELNLKYTTIANIKYGSSWSHLK